MTEPVSVTIFLVEDDEVEAEAVTRAFRKAHIGNPIETAKDGIEALEKLRGENGQQKLEKPYLILLDLNMPRMNGLEFLHELRNDANLCNTVVFVLTTSNEDRDKVAAYAEHIAGYIVKSQAGRDFLELIELLQHYWKIVEFPPES